MDTREDSVSANMASHALCRACMCNASNLQSVFIESKVMERKISEMITYVTGIQIEESDGLPKQICYQCVSLTESASFFKEQCYQSDTTFRRIIKNTQDERNLIKREKDCSIELEVKETSEPVQNSTKEEGSKDDVESLDSAVEKISSEKSPSDALYQCAVCSLRFQLCSRLKEHIKNEHEEHFKSKNAANDKVAKARFSCQICSKVFRSMTTYSAHYRRCEKKSISKKPKEKKIKEEIVSSDSDTPLAENLRYEDHNSDIEYNPTDIITEDHYNDDITIEKTDIKLELEATPMECEEIKSETVMDKNVKKNKVYSCVECDMTFNWKMFSLHMKTEHSNDISEKPAKVKREYKKLHKTNGVIEKKKTKKKKQDAAESVDPCDIIWNGDDISGDDGKDANTPVPYSCTMCERKFSKFTTLTLHLKKHEDQLSEVHTCLTCKREFKRKAHLDNHILTHSVEKGFKCTLCDKAFARQDSLSMHIANHEGIKKHQCNFCEKGFNMLSTLKDHIRTHTGEKPFLCSICGRGFSQSTNLKEHVRRHQGYKPFKCSFCDQTFVSKGELEAHTRKHSGAHPFVCDVCGGGFTTSSSLVKHKRIHTGERPYQCDFCPMRFTALGTLKNHRRTHTGEKPYKCVYCDKAFAQKNDLVSHTRTHTGERPYVCSACGHAFRQSSALKTHFKIHGGLGDQDIGCIKVPDPMLAITGLVVTKSSDDNTSVSLMTPKSETSQQ